MNKPHRHDAVEFIYTVHGSCRLGLTARTVNLAKNEIENMMILLAGQFNDKSNLTLHTGYSDWVQKAHGSPHRRCCKHQS